MTEPKQTLGEIQRRLTRLEQRMDERDEERSRFRGSWSDRDIEDLRKMLNGWIASTAIKVFWGSFLGKLILIGVALIQLGTFALAIFNFSTIHHP